MPRSEQVTVNGKSITVAERRIGELEALAEKLGGDLDTAFAADKPSDLKGTLFGLLYGKLPEVFPELTADDVRNAYPSEIEALLEAFVNANFFGVRKLAGGLLSFSRTAQARR